MAHVRLEHLTKRFEDVTAVDDLSIEIRDGEFVSLVGPSGCGKSTTMEMIAGLTKPSDGRVYIADDDVTNLAPKDRGVSMVFQNIALFPHMDVSENISFGLRLRKYDDDEIRRRVDRASEIVQLEGMLDRMPDELSGGQQQRVAIARAIVRNPDVFLMDEPLANLDAKLRVHMRTELQRLHRELDQTIVYVTHDQAEAMTMSNRIAVLDGGRLQQIAPPLVCYNEPANLFVAGFIGSPSMNLVDGELDADGLQTKNFRVEFDPDGLGDVSPGDAVTVGIRPEDIHLAEKSESVGRVATRVGATPDVIEPMGDETFVYLLLSEDVERSLDRDSQSTPDQLLMSVPSDTDIQAGRDIEVVFDEPAVHLFDTDTGSALVHGLEDVGDTGERSPVEEPDR